MKKVNILRLLFSLALIVFVSATLSFATTGSGDIMLEIAGGLFALGLIKGLVNVQVPAGLVYSDGFVISDTTYAGEVASQFAIKAITGADSINGGHVYVKDGIKKKYTIPRWDANYDDFIQDRKATPTSHGSMTVDGKVITPADYMIYMEFNPRDFEDHWYATQLNPALIDRALPPTVESVVVQGVMARHAKYFNKAIWNNDTTTSGIYKYFNGFIKNGQNDADVIDVGSPTTLTASNIVAEMEKGYVLIPDALKYDLSMKYFVSYATYDLYQQAQMNQTYKGADFTSLGRDTYKGLKVVKIADFPADSYMIAKGTSTPESNLWVGINSFSDEGLVLKQLQANSELWFIKMNMKADVQIGFGSEVVLYKA
jgi:hypothetical protein